MNKSQTGVRKPGNITAVMLTPEGPGYPIGKLHGAKRAGVAFENSFHGMMKMLHGDKYFPHQWFHFRDQHGWHWCQTDGILCEPDENRLIIYECKLKHHYRSYYQLKGLYGPVLEAAFPGFQQHWVTATRHYDPVIPYPVKPYIMKNVDDLPPVGKIGVFVWK